MRKVVRSQLAIVASLLLTAALCPIVDNDESVVTSHKGAWSFTQETVTGRIFASYKDNHAAQADHLSTAGTVTLGTSNADRIENMAWSLQYLLHSPPVAVIDYRAYIDRPSHPYEICVTNEDVRFYCEAEIIGPDYMSWVWDFVVIMQASADIDGNGTVDGGDLAILLSEWGTSGSADLDQNGLVDGHDLTILLNLWD